jgi:hypothetical protein
MKQLPLTESEIKDLTLLISAASVLMGDKSIPYLEYLSRLNFVLLKLRNL